MSLVMHLSDTHFGATQPGVVEALHRLIEEQNPNIVIHSGDVTQRALPSEFRAAKELMERHAASHWLVVPGNHDVPLWNPVGRLLAPYSAFTRGLGVAPESEIDLPDVLVLGVNTTRRWRHKHGQVSESQVERISERLRQARPEQLRVVVTHQPVHVIAQRDRINRLRGAERAVSAWSRAGADLLLGGHIHLPYVRPLHESARGVSRRTWVVQAGTAVSSRTRGRHPNSLYLIDHDGSRECYVARWDLDAEEQEFRAAESFALELERKAL
jgi:3',5'-cyclic AMP phosphodiesterase CpdA